MALINSINSAVKTTLFRSSGTFTKDPRTQFAIIWGCGGGGSGGSGRKGAAGTPRAGGGGGSSQGVFYYNVPASCIGSTETVTIGALGARTNAVTTDDTNGYNGNNGGVTSFGNLKTYSSAGNSYGSGGTTTSAAGGAAPTVITNFSYTSGSGGGASNVTGSGSNGTDLPLQTGGDHGYTHSICPTGGGGGGSIDSSNVAYSGGTGGSIYTCEAVPVLIKKGGSGGVANSNNAGRGSDWSVVTSGGLRTGSTGGGGGGANTGSNSMNGADAEYTAKGGAGGGGGGATLNGAGGTCQGGAGANGFVQIVEFLA